jgi:hypothetical protein
MAKLQRISLTERSNHFAKIPDKLLKKLSGNEVIVYGAMAHDAIYNHKGRISDISNTDIAAKYNISRKSVYQCRNNLIDYKIIIANNTRNNNVKEYEFVHNKHWRFPQKV